MDKNQKRLLLFAIQYNGGWHSYGTDRATIRAIDRLKQGGFILINGHRQFTLNDGKRRACDS